MSLARGPCGAARVTPPTNRALPDRTAPVVARICARAARRSTQPEWPTSTPPRRPSKTSGCHDDRRPRTTRAVRALESRNDIGVVEQIPRQPETGKLKRFIALEDSACAAGALRCDLLLPIRACGGLDRVVGAGIEASTMRSDHQDDGRDRPADWRCFGGTMARAGWIYGETRRWVAQLGGGAARPPGLRAVPGARPVQSK